MKIFQITVTFTEPTEAVITLNADTSEEAIARITSELGDQVRDLVIKNIEDVSDRIASDETTTTPTEADNVIDFNSASKSALN